MSDHDAAPDPIDKAYVQAETMLSDDETRAARRARVLAAVAREPANPSAAASSSARRPAWRRGGWLVAASVAGLGVFAATHVYSPALRQPLTEPGAPSPTPSAPIAAAPTPGPRERAASPTPSAETQTRAPATRTFTAAPPALTPPTTQVQPIAAPPAPPLMIPPVPHAFPAAPAPAPPPPPPAAVITAERRAPAPMTNDSSQLSNRASDEAVDAQGLGRGAATQASRQAIPAPIAAAPLSQFRSSAAPASQAARLHAAAAAGRIAEVEALLALGVPVDVPDADGNTALMKSIQADQPAAATLLRRHGASLERKNHAGERARDMATAKGDPALSEAVGLRP